MNSELIYFQMQMLQAEIKMNGMIATNKQREIAGLPLLYEEKDFNALVEEFGIHHNAFPFINGQ